MSFEGREKGMSYLLRKGNFQVEKRISLVADKVSFYVKERRENLFTTIRL
jgi:predicted transcriptional regulator of viral defense system